MTKFSRQQIKEMATDAKGKVVRDLEYDHEEDYFVLVFNDSTEMCFRFMSDLIND